MKIKLGADPEFFLKSGDKNVSAHGVVPGTKRNPHVLGAGAVQLDGTAVEFNIKPADDRVAFGNNIGAVLSELRSFVPEHYVFNYSPVVEYDKTYFDSVPESSKELGCDPDFNAYDEGKENPKPDASVTTMRTGAGHLHLGWGSNIDTADKSHLWDCCQIVQQLDGFFRYYEQIWDKDTKRRSLYGKPGAFRPKSYGVEYRVLSNAWLNYPKLWPWLYDACEYVFNRTVEGEECNFYVPTPYRKDLDRVNHFAVTKLGSGVPILKAEYLET